MLHRDGDAWPEESFDQVQAEVESRGDTRSGDEISIVHDPSIDGQGSRGVKRSMPR